MISESLCSLLNLSSSKNNDITKPGNYSTAPGNLNQWKPKKVTILYD